MSSFSVSEDRFSPAQEFMAVLFVHNQSETVRHLPRREQLPFIWIEC